LNNWLKRLSKAVLFILIWFVITTVGLRINKKNKTMMARRISLPSLFLSFAIPTFVCYSKWSDKYLWGNKKE